MNGSIKQLLAGVVIATCSAAALAQSTGGAGGGAGGAGGGSNGVGAGGGTTGAAGINRARPPGSTAGTRYENSGYGAPGTTATGGGQGTGTGAAPAPAPGTRRTMPYNNDNGYGNGGMSTQPGGGSQGSE